MTSPQIAFSFDILDDAFFDMLDALPPSILVDAICDANDLCRDHHCDLEICADDDLDCR